MREQTARLALITAFIAVCCFLCVVSAKLEHKCPIDQIDADFRTMYKGDTHAVSYPEGLHELARSAHREQRRSSSSSTTTLPDGVGPLRIGLDYSLFGTTADNQRTCLSNSGEVYYGDLSGGVPTQECDDDDTTNCKITCTNNNKYTDDLGDFIRDELMSRAVEFLSSHLRVVQVNGSLTLSDSSATCGTSIGTFDVPAEYLDGGAGFPDVDIILFVTARPTLGSVIAFASSCKDDQYNRPIMGHVNFGPNKIDMDDESEFELQVAVAIHEICHSLGFQGSKFDEFVDYSESQVRETVTDSNLGKDVERIITPTVIEKAAEHFGCTSIEGMEIEDGGGSGTGGSHWEKRVMMDEFMTGSASTNPQYSALTLALFEDSGWYYPIYDDLARFDWGRGEGCSFLKQKCSGWSNTYACSTASEPACVYDRSAKGYCAVTTYNTDLESHFQYFSNPAKGGTSELADYCPVNAAYSNGDCGVEANYAVNSYGENYHPDDGMCFYGNAHDKTLADADKEPHCYRGFCYDHGGPMYVKVGELWHKCASSSDKISLNDDDHGYDGNIDCPDLGFLCNGFDDYEAEFGKWTEFSSIKPDEGPADGGFDVTITGKNFKGDDVGGMTVFIGTLECLNVTVDTGSDTLTCKVNKYDKEQYNDITIVHVGVFDYKGRGGSGQNKFTITVADTGFLAGALELAKKGWQAFMTFAREYWFIVLPATIFIVLGGLTWMHSKRKAAKEAEEEKKRVTMSHQAMRARGRGRGRGGMRGRGGHGRGRGSRRVSTHAGPLRPPASLHAPHSHGRSHRPAHISHHHH